ncbi:MAG: phosphomannomutase/phosphoglucomutase [Candidatus Puniceispirillales bacterium]
MAGKSEYMMKHRFDPTILRAYDIRGILDETLTGKDAYAIGVGFAAHIRARNGHKVVMGRDGRLSSPMLADHLAKGLVAGGMHVIDIGVSPTPMLYFADRIYQADGAIQITGSHNPPHYNGFKMVIGHLPFYDADITGLGQMMAEGVDYADGGQHDHRDISDQYITALSTYAGDLGSLGHPSLVWDCGNGATGPAVEMLTSALPGQHQVLFSDIDGNFPNHHPDPVDPETLHLLRQAVADHHAMIGIGFDGDGDRIGLIDGKGRQVAGDVLTAYLAEGVLRRHPGAEIIFDVKSSSVALDHVKASGGKPQLWKTGHSHMKMRLKETGALLAGEMSGHLFLADSWYGFDDALLSAVAVLKEMAETGRDITQFVDTLPPVFATPELRIPCMEAEKFALVDSVTKAVKTDPDHGMTDINAIDGIRVTTDHGWWLIRASNTGAELVARAEGNDTNARDKLEDSIYHRLQTAGWKNTL